MGYRGSRHRAYRSQALEREDERKATYARMQARRANWVQASGPVPLDVWQASTNVDSFMPDKDGVNTLHVVRYPSGGFYFQIATGMGWTFRPCNWVGEGEAP